MELKLTKDVIQALKYNPAGPETQQVWEEGGSNLGISLSVRGKHQWIARVYVRQPDGSHQKRIGRLFWNSSIREKTLDEARREKAIWDGEAAQGLDPIEKRRPARKGAAQTTEEILGPATVSYLIETYMREYVAKELEAGTNERYQKLVRHIVRHLGDVPVTELDKAKLNAFKREMAGIRESFNKARKLISGAYRTADRLDWTFGGAPLVPPGLNPTLFVGPYDTKATRKAGDPFEPEEVAALAATAEVFLRPGAKFRYRPPSRSSIALGVFLLYTGMRKNEGMGLSWGNLNLPKESGWSGWIDLRRGGVQLIHHKTSRRKGPRVVPLSPQALQVLELMAGQDETWVFPGFNPGERLVQEFYGWRRLLRESGVRPRNIHQTRHTFITHALEAGAPIGAVAKAVGHTTVYITEIYGHISDRAARSAAELAGNHMHQLDWKWLNGREGQSGV